MGSSSGIRKVVESRNIKEVLHFTTNRGFLGCLASGGLLPRNMLHEDDLLSHILTLNAPFRTEEEAWFDQTEKWIEYVNLSISEITRNLFSYSMKWHKGQDLSWLILAFDPEILEHEGVYFTTTNNIYPYVARDKGAEGLEALFAPVIRRKGSWKAVRGQRPPSLPTCEQAEVLYPGKLSSEYLRTVYAQDGEDSDWVHGILGIYQRRDVSVVVSRTKFEGVPN